MGAALTLPPLGVGAGRSGLALLREEGSLVAPGEPVAFCSLSLDGAARAAFEGEDVAQAILASPLGGRLEFDDAGAGGLLDERVFEPWRAGETVCRIVGAAGEAPLRAMILAGRRIGWPVDAGPALLPGLYSRVRAFWGEGAAQAPVLAIMGLCDATGFMRGRRAAFLELFAATHGPAHVVHVFEKPLAPCAPVLLDGLLRAPAEAEEIAQDLRGFFADARPAPSPADLVFAGALLSQLGASPLRERCAVFDSRGLSPGRAPRFALMSSSAEPRALLRHRKLGYRLYILPDDLRCAGPAVRAWLSAAFAPQERTLDDIARDYAQLAQAAAGTRLIVVNRMSSSGREDILSYAPFDPPLGRTLAFVAGKETNLMLDDLAAAGALGVLDVDAIAAEIGGARHLADGIHQSEELQRFLRGEVLRILADAGRAFSPP
ncbi:hypothetical protein [Methylocella sp.]|uniref:hypothetical protein n=1 Tax=Methylocella sp. TaxID=1978226 RepID=UPI0035AE9FCB